MALAQITFNWTPAQLLMLAVIAGAPGIVLGAVCGALIWRGRPLSGALLGVGFGWGAGLAAFEAWSDTDASVHLSYAAALTTGAQHALPGALLGAALGAWFSPLSGARALRISRGALGALVGGMLWLAGWRLFTGGL